MKMFAVFGILLHISQHASAVEVDDGDALVLLPCDLPPDGLDEPSVVWSRHDLDPSTVHQRQQDGDELKDQNQLYSGQTSMKADALETGDLSLNLTEPHLSDSGSYTCTVRGFSMGVKSERRVADVQLQVKVPTERFPSWATALLVLLAVGLLVCGALLLCFRHYFMSDTGRNPDTCTVYNGEEDILTEKQAELKIPVCQVEVEEGEESVQLPFKTMPGLPKRATVMWTRYEPSYRIVHKYKNRSDRPKEQDQEYKDRTEVKKDLLKTGDLSLTLKNPKDETDTGEYWSGVIKDGREILREKIVKLKVKGRIQINDQTVDIRNRSTDPTPLMADRSVRSSCEGDVSQVQVCEGDVSQVQVCEGDVSQVQVCEGDVSGSFCPAAVRLYSQRCSQ